MHSSSSPTNGQPDILAPVTPSGNTSVVADRAEISVTELTSLFSDLFKFLIKDDYNSALNHITAAIENFAESSNLLLTRAYLRVFCPSKIQPEDNDQLIQNDIRRIVDLAPMDPNASRHRLAYVHKFYRDWYLIAGAYNKAAMEHDSAVLLNCPELPASELKETFLRLVNQQVPVYWTAYPERAFKLLKVKAALTQDPQDIDRAKLLEFRKEIFGDAEFPPPESPDPAPDKVPSPSIDLRKIVTSIVLESLGFAHEFGAINRRKTKEAKEAKEIDEEKTPSTIPPALGEKLRLFYPDLASETLSTLETMLKAWQPTPTTLEKSLCDRFLGILKDPEISIEKFQEYVIEYSAFRRKDYLRKARSMLTGLIEQHPSFTWAYLERAVVSNKLNPDKYRPSNAEDLQIAEIIHKQIRPEPLFDEISTRAKRNLAISGLNPKQALELHEVLMGNKQISKASRETYKNELMTLCDEAFALVFQIRPQLSYEVYKLKVKLTGAADGRAILAKLDAAFKDLGKEKGLDQDFIKECKGYALTVEPKLFSMTPAQVSAYKPSATDLNHIVTSLKDKDYRDSWPLVRRAVILQLAKEAHIDNDLMEELGYRMTYVLQAKLLKQFDQYYKKLTVVVDAIALSKRIHQSDIDMIVKLEKTAREISTQVDDYILDLIATEQAAQNSVKKKKKTKKEKVENAQGSASSSSSSTSLPPSPAPVPSSSVSVLVSTPTPVAAEIPVAKTVPSSTPAGIVVSSGEFDDGEFTVVDYGRKSKHPEQPASKFSNGKHKSNSKPQSNAPTKSQASTAISSANTKPITTAGVLTSLTSKSSWASVANKDKPADPKSEIKTSSSLPISALPPVIQDQEIKDITKAENGTAVPITPATTPAPSSQSSAPPLASNISNDEKKKEPIEEIIEVDTSSIKKPSAPPKNPPQTQVYVDAVDGAFARNLQHYNAYLEHTQSVNQAWQNVVGMQLAGIGIPLVPPPHITFEQFTLLKQIEACSQTFPQQSQSYEAPQPPPEQAYMPNFWNGQPNPQTNNTNSNFGFDSSYAGPTQFAQSKGMKKKNKKNGNKPAESAHDNFDNTANGTAYRNPMTE